MNQIVALLNKIKPIYYLRYFKPLNEPNGCVKNQDSIY